MGTSSKDPLASVSEGVTKGVLDFSAEKINEWITKFRNKELAFVEDPEVINLAKKQRTLSEWNFFKEHTENPDFRILFQMGLTLRRLENEPERLAFLRDKIVKKYGTQGLHIAQFVQNGCFNKYIGNILERASTPQSLTFEIESLFDNIEKTVVFIQQVDNVEKTTNGIVTKILANSPNTFIICGFGSAIPKCVKIKTKVMEKISDYTVESYSRENEEVYFLNKSATP